MNDRTPIPEFSEEDIEKVFDEVSDLLDSLHNKLASATEDVGYMRSVVYSSRPTILGLYEKAKDEPSIYPFIINSIEHLKGLNNELNKAAGFTGRLVSIIDPITDSTGTFAITSGSAGSLWDIESEAILIPEPPNRKSRDYYKSRLYELDPSLAKTYEEVWQTYLGTSSEPHRASLFMMRTLFDNFFAKLAPDEEVRGSQFWNRKDGDDPNQIWRSERISYALNKNIKDDNRREILKAEANNINLLYKAVNSAHNRGALDEEKATKTLMAMDNALKDWLDSLFS